MPNYFPENDTALPTDSSERSMAKVVSQLPAALDVIGLEPETAVYVARSGATDVAAIDAFVKGVKELGLWNNMVCWPLRSSQNAGSGNTVYSLGGLGTYNGTRVNNPAWTVDGIDFVAASNTHITTPLNVQNLRKFTTMVATDPSSYVNVDAMVSAWAAATASSQYFVLRRASSTLLEGIVRNVGATRRVYISGRSEDWRVYGWGTQGSSSIATESGAQIGPSLAFLPDETGSSTVNIGILSPPNATPFNGKIAWVFFYKDDELTTAQQLTVYNLYKSTLGTGLGLP